MWYGVNMGWGKGEAELNENDEGTEGQHSQPYSPIPIVMQSTYILYHMLIYTHTHPLLPILRPIS